MRSTQITKQSLHIWKYLFSQNGNTNEKVATDPSYQLAIEPMAEMAPHLRIVAEEQIQWIVPHLDADWCPPGYPGNVWVMALPLREKHVLAFIDIRFPFVETFGLEQTIDLYPAQLLHASLRARYSCECCAFCLCYSGLKD